MVRQLVLIPEKFRIFNELAVISPGRFFAANELKAIMAYIVVNYDIKFKDEGVRPPNIWHGISHLPSPYAEILFKRRKVDLV